MYYRGANAALLLYDITNAATFESVRGWLEGLPHSFRHARSTRVVRRTVLTAACRAKKELFTGPHHLYCRCQSRFDPPTPGHV